jgi:hypothetical protein
MKIILGSPFRVEQQFLDQFPKAKDDVEKFLIEYWRRLDILHGKKGKFKYCRELDEIRIKHMSHIDKTYRSVFDHCLMLRFFRTYVPYIKYIEKNKPTGLFITETGASDVEIIQVTTDKGDIYEYFISEGV